MRISPESARKSPSNTATATESSTEAQAWRELALDSLMTGEPASGLWFLRNAIEADADDPLTWQLMGRCFEEMGEESRARKCFMLALRQHALSDAGTDPHRAGSLPLFWQRRRTREI